MCTFHVKCSSAKTPRNLVEVTCDIGVPLIHRVVVLLYGIVVIDIIKDRQQFPLKYRRLKKVSVTESTMREAKEKCLRKLYENELTYNIKKLSTLI